MSWRFYLIFCLFGFCIAGLPLAIRGVLSDGLFVSGLSVFLLGLLHLLVFLVVFSCSQKRHELLGLVIGISFAVYFHLTLVAIAHVLGVAESVLWVPDSLSMHVPGALDFSAFINGWGPLRNREVVWDRLYFTQIWVGIWFSIFSHGPEVSSIAMMVVRLLVACLVFWTGSMWRGRSVGVLAAALYLTAPSVSYYSSVFYKESVVHLFVSLFFCGVIGLMRYQSRGYGILVALGLLGLVNERFYLFPLLIVGGGVFFSRTDLLRRHWGVLGLIGVTLTGGFLLVFGSALIADSPIEQLANFRHAYMSYGDVSSVNRELVYPLAVVKLLFSPYFTMDKIGVFTDISQMLWMTSLWQQMLTLAALFGLMQFARASNNKTEFVVQHSLFWLPYFSLLALFGYVAPYNGRLRDSLLPGLLIYSASAITGVSGDMAMAGDADTRGLEEPRA